MISQWLKDLKKLFPEKEKEISELSDDITKDDPLPKNEFSKEAKDVIDTLLARTNKLLYELNSLKTEKEENNKLLTQNAAVEAKAKIETAIKKAVDEKRIPALNTELQNRYKALLEKDYENGLAVIESIPVIADNKAAQAQTPNTFLKSSLEQGSTILDAVKQHNTNAVLGELK